MGLILAIGLTWVAHGQTRPAAWCGTGPEIVAQQRQLDEWLSAQHPLSALDTGIRVANGAARAAGAALSVIARRR